jgi:hypothetical protein
MNVELLSAPFLVGALRVGAVALLALAGGLAARPRARSQSLGWGVIAGLAYAALALVAALQDPDSEGLRAGLLQLVTVVLAAVIALLCHPSHAGQGDEPPANAIARVGRLAAWLALIGLAPTIGFHARLLVYRALLGVDWTGLTALAVAANALLLLPAAWSIRGADIAPVRGARAAAVLVLSTLMVVGGLYPLLADSATELLERAIFVP